MVRSRFPDRPEGAPLEKGYVYFQRFVTNDVRAKPLLRGYVNRMAAGWVKILA